MRQIDSSQVRSALFHYDLVPRRLTPHGRIIRVDTAAGSFALKSKRLSAQQIDSLQSVYRMARHLMIDAVCPLPSKYGDLVIHGSETSFYLMPWINETVPAINLPERYRHLFAAAGHLHRQTREKSADASAVYKQMVRILNARQMAWASFIDRAEHHTYPSPFEQAVLRSVYIYMDNAQTARDFFLHDGDGQGGKKKIGRALCHGRLNPLHVLIEQERNLLTNFENSETGCYIVEIGTLFEQAAALLDTEQADWQAFYQAYRTACPLNDEDEDFLLHFLLFPDAHAVLLQRYLRDTSPDELQFTRQWGLLCRNHETMYTAIRAEVDKARNQKRAQETREQEKDKKAEE